VTPPGLLDEILSGAPAEVASSAFVSPVTDACGFLLLLGRASWLLWGAYLSA